MQRTVGEARQYLTEVAPQLNPEAWAALDGEVQQAEKAARGEADTYPSAHFTEASLIGHAAVLEVCALRDQANALVAEARAGRLSAADVTASTTCGLRTAAWNAPQATWLDPPT